MSLKVRDQVEIIGDNGEPIAYGVIVNINHFREPCHEFAVDVTGFTEDVLFFSKSQLRKRGEAKPERIEDLLWFFEDHEVNIQITVTGRKPVTVHAFQSLSLHKSSGPNVLEALRNMKYKLYGENKHKE